MKDILNLIKNKSKFYSIGNISEENIKEAELILNIRFASDYRMIIKEYGAVTFSGHELTGICNSKRLNVVDVTKEERKYNKVPEDWYVIEQANIDDIVIWQDTNGAVYQTMPNKKPIKLCNSLLEYIDF
ncbi:SMI1/KNR4 family protein [Ruminococcus sp. FMB-CY1]|uniref:SMI1/KNR4 family protein n=1 Tax=Eubacteriales TaxID=186802 RepID=UPI001314293E|nr:MULTISPECIES: SMI1/KNR4 family protein [Eubacteriales]USP69239.1 SMI1/KNR4 family protein [Ruminococcus sp. FMBCY1]WBX57465.1 SMI1/KNR4 family protein [Ruminococcus sp. FMB-CY1]